ncbi:MAG TPA: pyridoxamine 5'-phosphate oxidase family protein [Aggregatilineales bacterium]|nr:pyridoxamine 5'-phosphate oxidase family protein [Aggregatilineales bacterium]
MEVARFEDIQTEFMHRAQKAVYCNVATVDRKGRPRSRVMHVIWEGPMGWVITWPESHKAKHLANNPYVSLAYVTEPKKPIYVEGIAAWVQEVVEQQRIWDLHKAIPPPLGFDPTPHYGTIQHKYFGLLRFTPWRVELAELGSESLIWRPGAG